MGVGQGSCATGCALSRVSELYVLVLILLLFVPLEWLFLGLIAMCVCSCLQGSASGGVGHILIRLGVI